MTEITFGVEQGLLVVSYQIWYTQQAANSDDPDVTAELPRLVLALRFSMSDHCFFPCAGCTQC